MNEIENENKWRKLNRLWSFYTQGMVLRETVSPDVSLDFVSGKQN